MNLSRSIKEPDLTLDNTNRQPHTEQRETDDSDTQEGNEESRNTRKTQHHATGEKKLNTLNMETKLSK